MIHFLPLGPLRVICFLKLSFFKKILSYSFIFDLFQPFPACNRELIGNAQDFNALCKYFSQFDNSEFYQAICDFQLLVALAKLEVYPMLNHLEDLVDAIREQDKSAVEAWSLKEHWQTVYQLMQAQGLVTVVIVCFSTNLPYQSVNCS